ncbi:MAG TPA: response regulator, partial [Isosphaeraceae bacterium]|nr:response regulator [Isosphaeraceae bacterium]
DSVATVYLSPDSLMSPHREDAVDESRLPRVLVVDDSAEGRRGLSRLLEIHGFEVHSVESGTQALEFLQSCSGIDAVLTDLFLPDVDGREIGEIAYRLNPRPFIALVTGWTRSEQAEELDVPYFDEVFLKPIDIRQVVQILRERLGKSA